MQLRIKNVELRMLLISKLQYFKCTFYLVLTLMFLIKNSSNYKH